MSITGEIHVTVNDVERVLPLTAPRFTIGRDVKNALPLLQAGVSRYHAEIIRLGKDFLLRDLGSTNGSFVNGARVSEQLLNDGDILRFGRSGPQVTFRFIEQSQATESERHRPGTTESLIKSLSGKLEPLKDAREDVNLRCVLAEAYLSKGEHQAALKALSSYIDIGMLSRLPLPFRATVLYWLGRVYVEQKQYPLAIDALRRSLEMHEQVGDDSGTSGVYASLGRAFIGTEELLAARDNLHRALLMARRAGNARLLAEVHLLLGKIDWKETDLEGARYNWTRAARLAEGTSDALFRARVQLKQAIKI
jgi:pSer/pThr/pTyr-binding forkhead associated (FHA) protein